MLTSRQKYVGTAPEGAAVRIPHGARLSPRTADANPLEILLRALREKERRQIADGWAAAHGLRLPR